MKAPQKKTFRDFLTTHVPLVVPLYQRSYAWESEQIDDVIADVQRTVAHIGSEDLESEDDKDLHFFGGVVTVREDDTHSHTTVRWDVVDGQQRLATMMLAVRLLVDAYEQIQRTAANAASADESEESQRTENQAKIAAKALRNNVVFYDRLDPDAGTESFEPRLTLSEVDIDFFRSLVIDDGESTQPDKEQQSHKRLADAKKRLDKRLIRPITGRADLSEAQKFQRLRAIETALLDYSYIIHIFTTNRNEAYHLFSILNDRGRDLTDADLLRTRTLELLRDSRDIQRKASNLWEDILNHTPSSIDSFLRAYYASVTGFRAPTRGLFDNFSAAFLPPDVADSQQAKSVLNLVSTLHRSSGYFHEIAASRWPYSQPNASSWSQKRLERLISVLGRSGDIPILLAARECRDEAFFANLVDAMERLAFRYAVSRGHSGTLSEAFYKQAAKLRRDEEYSLGDLHRAVGLLVALRSTDEAFAFGLRQFLTYSPSSSKNNRRIKHALTTIDDYWTAYDRWAEVGKEKRVPSQEAPYDLDQVQIEHVYPQRPRDGQQDAKLDEFVHDLGNLAFWQGNENERASNKPYAEKSPDLRSARAHLTQEAGSYDSWTTDVVLARRQMLIDRLVWIYEFPVAAVEAARLASRGFWLAYHKLDDGTNEYQDVMGESYHYPKSIPNGSTVTAGDYIFLFSRYGDSNKIFGVGLIGEVLEDDEGYRTAYYSHYLSFDDPVEFGSLDHEPRSNKRNAINAIPLDLAESLLPEGASLESLPEIEAAG